MISLNYIEMENIYIFSYDEIIIIIWIFLLSKQLLLNIEIVLVCFHIFYWISFVDRIINFFIIKTIFSKTTQLIQILVTFIFLTAEFIRILLFLLIANGDTLKFHIWTCWVFYWLTVFVFSKCISVISPVKDFLYANVSFIFSKNKLFAIYNIF